MGKRSNESCRPSKSWEMDPSQRDYNIGFSTEGFATSTNLLWEKLITPSTADEAIGILRADALSFIAMGVVKGKDQGTFTGINFVLNYLQHSYASFIGDIWNLAV